MIPAKQPESAAKFVGNKIQNSVFANMSQSPQEMTSMGFVSEYASEEGVKKYKLKELWQANRPGWVIPEDFQYNWTVDKGRGIYCIEIEHGVKDEPGSARFILNIDGMFVPYGWMLFRRNHRQKCMSGRSGANGHLCLQRRHSLVTRTNRKCSVL